MFQGHGDDGYRQQQPVRADFSTNVWYGGPPEGLKEYLFENWDAVKRYPEVLAESLTERIAAFHRLSAGHILVNSGSTESIYLVARAFSGTRSTVVIPAFAEYEDACMLYGHQLEYVHWDDWPEKGLENAGLCFICNPNNPTGAVRTGLEKILSAYPHVIFVVDEAFIEFTLSCTSIIALVARYPNLIVLRSLTKAYAIPGLRLGYIAAAPALLARVRSGRMPWSVNAMALHAGNFIFDRPALLDHPVPLARLMQDKADFICGLSAAGLLIEPGHTHFFTAETPLHTAAELKAYLLEKHRLLIRDAANFRGLGQRHLRLATLGPAENQLLLQAVSQWVSR